MANSDQYRRVVNADDVDPKKNKVDKDIRAVSVSVAD